jgi:hypothetical protein
VSLLSERLTNMGVSKEILEIAQQKISEVK